MYRATHLFYETTDDNKETGESSTGLDCPRTQRQAVYPSVGNDKMNLNSAVYDQDSTQDVISLSCFTKPFPKTQRLESTKAATSPLISHEAMMRMGYNFKLAPKQRPDRLHEI